MFVLKKGIDQKVRMKRASKQVTLEQLSQKINVSRKTLSLIEKGKKEKLNSRTYENVMNWLIGDD
ncbi:putative HTH type transcriptionnel regulator [Brochothrix thermosphacta]|uniref:helix-turn-helix domain-containing protein n=1 Tax=Brochothrix thermosphacta TaxID=2756 RepID=UPI000D77855A|nr:helix-turn-helix domain-containing protein [Brochothrix thermosphacta]ANZ94790.1 hypothetical protein BFC19_04950 [Brochothrix thermosphacta]SPN70990.1 putative HTH type transcriptionnel regulator [Brochothrix thermosphacta]